MIARLYCGVPLAADAEIALPEAAAHHAARVLRLKSGDEVTLFNGEGGEFTARLDRIEGRDVFARIDARIDVERESPLPITLVQGIAAAERMDIAIQKAVELGVSRIRPVTTVRSVIRLDAARAQKRLLHWRQIAISACEQCGRNRIPEVLAPVDLGAWLRAPSAASLRLLFAPAAQRPVATLSRPSGPIECLIGPEGGLDASESAAARAAGFQEVSIGPRVLRAETAGTVTLAMLNTLWGDFR
jgi:16S rRNA (uracil1498-N3)-methyltransferase